MSAYRYSREALAHLVAKGLTDIEIGRMYGVSPATVANRRWRAKVHRQQVPCKPGFPHVTAEFIRERVQRGMSDLAIGKEAGCSDTVIAKRRKTAGILSAVQAGTRTVNTQGPASGLGAEVNSTRQLRPWPDMPADAFRDVRTRHHGGRIRGTLGGDPGGLGEWTL